MFKKVGYFIVYVKNMDKSVSFWRDKIGILPSYTSETWSEFPLENVTLALHQAENVEPRDTGVVFHVENIEDIVEKLRERGVGVTPIKDIGVGKEAFFKDPEGNRYGIFQPSGQA